MTTLFGKEVRKLRIDKEVTLRKMADELEISPSHLSSVETGKRALTDDLKEKIISFFRLDGVVADNLRDLASRSSESLKIELSSLNNQQSESALFFARKLDKLSDEDINKIMEVLKKDE